MVLLGLVGFALLGAVASVHLRRTPDFPEATAMQRRARRDPDGGYLGRPNAGRLVAAQRKRARRAARNLKVAGRGGIHRPDIQVSPLPPSARWWRRTARR